MTREPETLTAAGQQVAVRVPIAPLYAEARVSSPQVSQRLAGHLLTVVERRDEWLRVAGADGYEGWTHVGYVEAPHAVPGAGRLLSLGCAAARPGGEPRLLPLGAWLGPEERVTAGDTVAAEAMAQRFPPDGTAIGGTAVGRFAGTSYQWGGITPWGADCSGLVQSVFALHGIQLPRDAWQQAREGRDAGREIGALVPGDLLFFSDRADGRITHVGIALGGARMVHLALGRGGWAVERLDDARDDYVRALVGRFTGARRIVDAR